ncbi:MAG: CBS domain-containing protein [Deltaproteobacteria bacterium]|nr:CBS domain-containing protein [Deltaproteobacteria bacterium]MBT6491874.1 CBS domain-containing protein [Deltaproteobacteria bacterium]
MSQTLITISPDLSIDDAKERMAENGIRHIPVLENNRLIGILSARDLLVFDSIPTNQNTVWPVSAAMTTRPITCPSDTPLAEALELMSNESIGAVPVMDGDEIKGIFTSVDAINILQKTLI